MRPNDDSVRNMRITYTDIISLLGSGIPPDEILRDFPELTMEDLREAQRRTLIRAKQRYTGSTN